MTYLIFEANPALYDVEDSIRKGNPPRGCKNLQSLRRYSIKNRVQILC